MEVDGNVSNNGNLLTITGSGNSLFTGVISGSGGLTVSGGAMLTLSNTNTYSGATAVGAATLSFPGGLLPPSSLFSERARCR